MPMELTENNNNEPSETVSGVNGSLSTHSHLYILNGDLDTESELDSEMMDTEPIFDETDLSDFAEQIELESTIIPSAVSQNNNNNVTSNNIVTNGPVVSSNVIEYFGYDDEEEDEEDENLDSSTCTQIEVPRIEGDSVSSTPTRSSIMFACDDVATLKRSSGGKDSKFSQSPSTTLTTFSVATYTSPQGNGATNTSSSNARNSSLSSHNSGLVNGSLSTTENHQRADQSSDRDEEIFSMDEELTLKNGGDHNVSTYRSHQAHVNSANSPAPQTDTFAMGGKSYTTYVNNPFYGSNGTDPSAPTSSNLIGMMSAKGKLHSTDAALSMLIDSLPTSSGSTSSSMASSGNSSMDVGLTSGHHPMEMPYAIMTNKENSCPFFERRIGLMVPVKVGRAIARVRPAPDNAIFDCKVLSRNHALLWFQDGKFYLRDTCSSNGTFINNARLSSANEKSQPHELFSGDCVQFGVEVTEKKQVHSCVIATIRLFLPDGTEAKPTSIASDYGLLDEYHHQKGGSLYGPNSYLSSSLNITPSQLIELSHFIKDALHKQCLLESQLDSMKQVMAAAMDSAKSGWSKLVEEDQLLSRIESLQAKLEVLLVAKANTGDGISEDAIVETLKQELLHLISDKEKFELSSKCALAKALEEKMSALSNLHLAEMELQAKEEECHKLNTMVSQNMKEMQGLVANCDKARKDVEELVAKLRQTEDDQSKLHAKFEHERSELQDKVSYLEQTSSEHQAHAFNAVYQPLPSNSLTRDSNAQTDKGDNVMTTSLHSDETCQPNRTALTAANRLPQSTLDSDSSHNSIEPNCLNDTDNRQYILLRKHEEEIYKAKRALASTRSQCQDFYKSTMSCLVSVDSLLAEKDSAIGTLTERVQSIACQLQTMKHRQRDQLDQLNMLLESEQEDNLRLAREVHTLEELIDKQNEELEKFKCDIDVLRNGQVMEKEKQKARLPKVESAVQTDTDVLEGEKTTSQTMAEWSSNKVIMEEIKPLPTLTSMKEQFEEIMKSLNKIVSTEEGQLSENESQTSDLCQTVLAQLNQVVKSNERLKEENDHLADKLATIKEKFSLLSYQNELSFCMALCPLLVIFIAVILAFYPILSYLMGTSGV